MVLPRRWNCSTSGVRRETLNVKRKSETKEALLVLLFTFHLSRLTFNVSRLRERPRDKPSALHYSNNSAAVA